MARTASFLTRMEIKYHSRFPVTGALGVVFLCLLLFGLQIQEEKTVWLVIERFLPLAGLFLLLPLFLPEQIPATMETLLIRKKAYWIVYGHRLLFRLILFGLITAVYVFLLSEERLPALLPVCLHTFGIALFVSGLGLFFESLTRNPILSYLLASCYLILQWFVTPATFGWFYLYTGPNGIGQKDVLLSILGLCLVLLSLRIRYRNRQSPSY